MSEEQQQQPEEQQDQPIDRQWLLQQRALQLKTGAAVAACAGLGDLIFQGGLPGLIAGGIGTFLLAKFSPDIRDQLQEWQVVETVREYWEALSAPSATGERTAVQRWLGLGRGVADVSEETVVVDESLQDHAVSPEPVTNALGAINCYPKMY